jgi:hypothetical protein
MLELATMAARKPNDRDREQIRKCIGNPDARSSGMRAQSGIQHGFRSGRVLPDSGTYSPSPDQHRISTSYLHMEEQYMSRVIEQPHSSGNCLNNERAEGVYADESGQTSGRSVCYQRRA